MFQMKTNILGKNLFQSALCGGEVWKLLIQKFECSLPIDWTIPYVGTKQTTNSVEQKRFHSNPDTVRSLSQFSKNSNKRK